MSLNFKSNRLFTPKQLKARNFKDSVAMKMLLGERRIAKALDKKQERNELYRELKARASGGGVTKTEIREVLGYFRSGKGRSIDKGEAQELAKGIFSPSSLGSPYIYRREEKEEGSRSFTGKALRDEKKEKISEEKVEKLHTKYGDIERIKNLSPDRDGNVIPPKNIVRLTGQ